MQNSNYPNWLVPLHLAKQLKKIGFNELCLIENVETHSEDYSFINFEEEMYSDSSVMLEDVVFVKNEFLEDNIGLYKDLLLKTAIPTWEQVFEWFREKGFIGAIEYKDFYSENNYEYAYCITNKLDKKTYHSIGHSITKTYEEAREELVNKLIEIYKKCI